MCLAVLFRRSGVHNATQIVMNAVEKESELPFDAKLSRKGYYAFLFLLHNEAKCQSLELAQRNALPSKKN